MSKKNFIEACVAASNCTMAHSRNEVNLFCEIMGLPKSNLNYFIGDDPHGVVDIMEGYYCFNMTDIHVVISEYERWLKIYGDNKGIRKAVDAWYYYRKDWYEQHSSEEPRWVSVEDGKPQVGQQVYAYLKHEKCALAAMYCKGDYGHFWGLNKERPFGDTVTHWKPIITPEQEAERSKGCPNLRSWLAGCPVEGLRKPSLRWIDENLKAQEAARQRVEECKQALEDAIEEEVKLNKF
jgi:hypothetical protein